MTTPPQEYEPYELTAEDGDEHELAYQIGIIRRLIQSIDNHGFDQKTRFADRRGYWRYSEVERSLWLISGAAHAAQTIISSLDFPERDKAGRYKPVKQVN